MIYPLLEEFAFQHNRISSGDAIAYGTLSEKRFAATEDDAALLTLGLARHNPEDPPCWVGVNAQYIPSDEKVVLRHSLMFPLGMVPEIALEQIWGDEFLSPRQGRKRKGRSDCRTRSKIAFCSWLPGMAFNQTGNDLAPIPAAVKSPRCAHQLWT